jgi:hypothetical protein
MSERMKLAALLGVDTARRQLGMNAPPDLRFVPPSKWLEHLDHVDCNVLVRSAIYMFRVVFVPRWLDSHRQERRPLRAIEAAEQCFKRPSEEAMRHAWALAEACADVQADEKGATHRIAECARAVAYAAIHPNRATRLASLTELFMKAEEELAITSAAFGFHRRPEEIRAQLLDAIGEVLLADENK